MKLKEIIKIEDPKERAIQASLCSELPEEQRYWCALLACCIGLDELERKK